MKKIWDGGQWWFKKRDPLSDVANVITIGSALGRDENKDAACCQPCCSGSHGEQSRDKSDCSTDDTSRPDAAECESLSTKLDKISTDIGSLKDRFVSDTFEPPASNEASKIESALTTSNSTLSSIDKNVNRLADRFTGEAPDKTGNDKTQESNWSLMLLANIAIDMKRMADQYVNGNLIHSSNGPVFQNIRDTGWLNSTLNGIQDSTSRTVSLLPIQPNNYFNQNNNFTISGAQEPRVVAQAVRESMPMMSDFSQANQILQAKII